MYGIGGGRSFGMGDKITGGLGTGVPQRGPGAEPDRGLGGRNPQKLKNF